MSFSRSGGDDLDGGAKGEGETDEAADATAGTGDLDCVGRKKRYRPKSRYAKERPAWSKSKVALGFGRDASLVDQSHAAGSSGSRVMSSMSPRSWGDRADSWALGGNRLLDDDDDAFGCVIVGLACWSRVKGGCVQRKRKCDGLLIRSTRKFAVYIEYRRLGRS
ncbi:hypothetical protein EDB83DRAFT_436856 [Lactarius deliciosus]|nr:hypothetical protein EDB83DRAFT_436856 [Lactarius deliciosus]